ncbi:MAG: hemerythrin domain-containing protein [Arenicellales bacterium]
MGLFNRRRRRQQPDEDVADGQRAPTAKTVYDASLIERLTAEHRLLMRLLADCRGRAAVCDFDNLAEALRRFKRALQEHLLAEDLALYAYLAKYPVLTPMKRRLARSMRLEMVDIRRRVNQFVAIYSECGVDHDNVDHFEYHLADIVLILSQRIRQEERLLYTLYAPPPRSAGHWT